MRIMLSTICPGRQSLAGIQRSQWLELDASGAVHIFVLPSIHFVGGPRWQWWRATGRNGVYQQLASRLKASSAPEVPLIHLI